MEKIVLKVALIFVLVIFGLKQIDARNIAFRGSDDFSSKNLDPQWMWNYQPRADKWSLTERRGYLRLHAFKPLEESTFFKAGNTICHRQGLCQYVFLQYRRNSHPTFWRKIHAEMGRFPRRSHRYLQLQQFE